MIPSEWAAKVAPPPGKLLVQRDSPTATYRGLWTPTTFQAHTRKVYAKVVAIGQDTRTSVDLGDWVILAPNCGRRIIFGYSPSTEVELWVIPPEGIIGKLLFDLEKVKVLEASQYSDRAGQGAVAAANFSARRAGTEEDDRFDEADPRSLR